MPQFKDSENRTWNVNINVLDVRYLRVEMGLNIAESESLHLLFDDEERQYEVLWALVSKQAKELGVDEVGFANIFTTCFVPATKALTEALQLFSQQTGRPELSELIGKILNASTKLRSVIQANLRSPKFDQVLNKLLVEEEKRMDKAMDQLLMDTSSSGESPESSGSIPSPSPTES